jgi:flagellar basal-body rod protein FlgC
MAEINPTSAMDISASALSAQNRRMAIIATNIANAESMVTPEGGPYRRREVTFATVMRDAMDAPSSAEQVGGVKIDSVSVSREPLQSVYDPQHPMASKDGFVQRPNINVTREMVDMVSAQRSYEANLSAMKAYREMQRGALSILKR